MTGCTGRQYVEACRRRFSVCSAPQMGIAIRAEDYGIASAMWARLEDHARAKEMARFAATLAYLAFPDLRQESEQKEVAA